MLKQDSSLFDAIVDDLRLKGYSIQLDAIDQKTALSLYQEISSKPAEQLMPAGIGRDRQHTIDKSIRSDHIEWIDESTPIGNIWLNWAEALRVDINRKLFLGLDEFESHYAYYPKGAFYQRHKDAFVGESNRVLSLVAYLNPNWQPSDGGELVLYREEDDSEGVTVQPQIGTLVLFLSEEFPHEVLPSSQDRYSIAGWFRQKPKTS